MTALNARVTKTHSSLTRRDRHTQDRPTPAWPPRPASTAEQRGLRSRPWCVSGESQGRGARNRGQTATLCLPGLTISEGNCLSSSHCHRPPRGQPSHRLLLLAVREAGHPRQRCQQLQVHGGLPAPRCVLAGCQCPALQEAQSAPRPHPGAQGEGRGPHGYTRRQRGWQEDEPGVQGSDRHPTRDRASGAPWRQPLGVPGWKLQKPRQTFSYLVASGRHRRGRQRCRRDRLVRPVNLRQAHTSRHRPRASSVVRVVGATQLVGLCCPAAPSSLLGDTASGQTRPGSITWFRGAQPVGPAGSLAGAPPLSSHVLAACERNAQILTGAQTKCPQEKEN